MTGANIWGIELSLTICTEQIYRCYQRYTHSVNTLMPNLKLTTKKNIMHIQLPLKYFTYFPLFWLDWTYELAFGDRFLFDLGAFFFFFSRQDFSVLPGCPWNRMYRPGWPPETHLPLPRRPLGLKLGPPQSCLEVIYLDDSFKRGCSQSLWPLLPLAMWGSSKEALSETGARLVDFSLLENYINIYIKFICMHICMHTDTHTCM